MSKHLPLNHGKFALIDDEDYERASQFKWTLDRNGYIVRKQTLESKKYQKVLLHRFLVDAPETMDVDHKDRNPLNNTRSNLRICNRSQNSMNRPPKPNSSSQYKGVCYHKRDKIWLARLCGKTIGRFITEIEAAMAYDKAATIAFGEFAYLNFPKL